MGRMDQCTISGRQHVIKCQTHGGGVHGASGIPLGAQFLSQINLQTP